MMDWYQNGNRMVSSDYEIVWRPSEGYYALFHHDVLIGCFRDVDDAYDVAERHSFGLLEKA